MLRALYSGVAGLKTHQTKMDVIGNNIANVNTYGFKSSRASFKDVFYQTLTGSSNATDNMGGGNASQVGYGSMVSSIDVLHTRAGFTPTGRAMDVFIEGEGYLVARDGAGNELLTRVGVLNFDGQGNLVDANRNYICGYPIARDAAGNIIYEERVAVAGSAKPGDLEVAFGAANGDKLNGWNIKVVNGTPASSSVSGKTITVTGANAGEIEAQLKALDKTKLPDGVDPSLFTATLKTGGTFPATGVEVVAPIGNGVTAQTGIPKLDKANGPQRIKKPGTLSDSNGDGIPDQEATDVAELKGIAIGADGIISGTTADGKIIPIGQICLANVPNPEALVLEGNSYFKAVNNTGDITYAGAGEGVSGSLISGGLEMSNVDLSTEFADMIITQRGFQANSRIITVGDEMLQELVNMKR
ncbi:flagellar hook-basal body complex protein [Paludicola sp. MB14-C6]|uniref:flagellar hook protein FlgE n=1 Tax=Paludihabitans sp. MB14-C6 TaxID=3070656 RepID=UPI0027DE1926|nr:flagellar hook-basal body complex protein [Paludicola sp. MB14-C6]WMJ24243.1 flagellar hook-basal body complex protein [Paludicola sp. MB14-C6]